MSADRLLASRIEHAQAAGTARAIRDLATTFGEPAYRTEPVLDGWLCLTPPDVPLFGVRGVGFAVSVDDASIDTVERISRDADLDARFDVCPLADESLDSRLAARGYSRSPSCEVWVRGVAEPLDDGAPAQGVSVVPVPSDDASMVDLFAETVARGYREGDTPHAWNVAIGRNAARRSDRHAFLARVDGEAAGGGILAMTAGLGTFSFMSTLPSLRRRGVQSALMHARFAHARQLGADAVCVQCEQGSATARNAQRLGFRKIYERTFLTRTI